MSDTPDVKLDKLEEACKHVQICRDFYEGSTRVMTEGYLPKWTGETKEGYDVRLAMTAFPNFFNPVVDGLTGMITKKEPAMTDLDEFNLNDVDMRGTGLTSYIKQVCASALVAGIEFIAVESNEEENRAYFKRYSYEDLMSYHVEGDVITQLVFKDTIEVPKGKFGIEKRERYVVFRVGGGDVWYDDGNGLGIKDSWENNLDVIPVSSIKIGREKSLYEVTPKLVDVALLNKVALNLESQLANVLSVVGNPVPVFYGEPDDDGVSIGVKDALVFEDRQTQGFEYIEVTGNGVNLLEGKLKTVAETIDKMSFNLLQKNKSATVIDAQENQSRSTSFLSDVATELENKFNRLLRWWSEIEGIPMTEEAGLDFKKDFDDVLFSDSQLKLLHDLVSTGDLSRETLWDKLKVSNILPKDFDPEIERERIEVEV